MEHIDERIRELEELKKRWGEKYGKRNDHVKSFQSCGDLYYVNDFKKELEKLNDELSAIGKDYHEKLNEALDEVVKGFEDNPYVMNMRDGVSSDIDDTNGTYNGNREARLKDLSNLIDILKNIR